MYILFQSELANLNISVFYPIMEKDSNVRIKQLSDGHHSQQEVRPGCKCQSPKEMLVEFVDNTTLHGIRYAFMERHILVRLIWVVLLLISGGYYLFTVQKAFHKYYDHPINTVLSHKHVNRMEFPAITICSRNMFALSKLLMTDDNPLFASSGLNISSCAVTSEVRGDRPCGWSLLCALPEFENASSSIPNCTNKYRKDLLDAMQRSRHYIDKENLYRYYSQDLNSLLGPRCYFNFDTTCSEKDFVSFVTQWSKCYTFNSGENGKIMRSRHSGVSFGLFVIFDAQTGEGSHGKYSEGFKVLIHKQGEFFNEWEGISVAPGQHAVITVSEKRVTFSTCLKLREGKYSNLILLLSYYLIHSRTEDQ